MKIATCSYCGTRAALVLGGEGRHELACSSCGAPLHALKMLPAGPLPPVGPADHRKSPKARSEKTKKPKAPKRRKGVFARVLEEAMDAVEDIFD